MAPTVLVTGGTGYLGQFLVDNMARSGWTVVYTYLSSAPPPFPPGATGFKVDLTTGEGLDACMAAIGDSLTAVINTVAVSQPAACEADPARARAVNVPTKLLDALESYKSATGGQEPLLVHLSTDQVYDGSKAWWTESDTADPINEYGKSKLEAEKTIAARWKRHLCMRSSLIYGPEPPAAPVGRALFLQFVARALTEAPTKGPTTFFEDEWRCAVYVQDIVNACRLLVEAGDAAPTGVFNAGGPERLSRVDMARGVAAVLGLDPEVGITPVPSASVARGVASPPDISMRSGRLEEALGMKFTRFEDALKVIFNKN